MTQTTASSEMLVRFGRRQSKGVLLGFSGLRLTALGAAVCVLVIGMFTAGKVGLLLGSPFVAVLVASVFVRWNGEPVVDAMPTLAHWGTRSAARQTRYRVRTHAPRPAGTAALPGDAASLRVHMDKISGAAMIHDPHRQTLSAVVHVSHPAYVLLSPEDQNRRVAAWSRVLAGLAATGSCSGVQVLETTLPDPGHGVRDWYLAKSQGGPAWSAAQYEELMHRAAPTSYTHRTLIVLSLDMRRAARAIREHRRGIAGAAEVLRGDINTCAASLRAADLLIERWLDERGLAAVLRQAYDPIADDDVPRSVETAGPVAIDERWDHLRHDSAFSTVLWISEWPRVDVTPQFLHSLIFLQNVRKTISITAKPLGTGEALRSIRKEKVEYLTEASQNARIGKISDLSAEQEYEDVLARERALISGHADMRFSGFITITARTHDELSAAVAATERAATQCGCETRVLFGQQAQAFTAAALPLARGVH